ncbi:MAG: anaerobic ribonucleoside-triphosphate reductase activating protein [Sarcina sp.]
MYYSRINNFDVLNGEGFRVVLFVSGCNKIPKCKSCQNKCSWKFDYGFEFTQDTEDKMIELLRHDSIDGISLSGGEITDNLEDGTIFKLLDRIKTELPNKTVWAWSGYNYEDMLNNQLKTKFLSYVDILIDGEYVPELKDLSRPWGNSRNQRVILSKESLLENKTIIK